jgi:predicted ATP-dependent endonuclease of OLD family
LELQSIKLSGFRRFVKDTELKTNGKLVAILGPNEAGKTSLLNAITHVGDNSRINKYDLTRGKDFGDDNVVITSRFRLDDSDLAAAHLSEPTWYVLKKKVSGAQTYAFEPSVPKRDISNRKKLLKIFERIQKNNKLWGRLVQEEDAIETFDAAAAALSSNQETLDSDALSALVEFAEFAADNAIESDPKYFNELSQEIESQLSTEKVKTPEEFAKDVIYQRLPQVLFFSNEDRLLKGSYTLEELADGIPAALQNLCKVAKIDADEFVAAINENDPTAIARLKSLANDELKARSESWSQSGVRVEIDVTNNEIQVMVREEDYQFTRLAERSDGLRQFVALQAFASCERAENPILLIDEAEMRLHYDAQADLVQVLSKQTVSSKVIYTTHSAGCLPEDLGNGVRLVDCVVNADGSAGSVVKNHFWNRSEGGLDPLLIGMGAATLAFFPIRRALLTEGESDMLLLPTMLRESLDVVSLTFQIVPGLSKTSGINLPILARNGKGVAFALDFDKGGRALEEKIVGAGFDREAIFYVRGATSSADVQIEDFISPKILAHGCNEAFRKLGSSRPDISSSAFRASGRLDTIARPFEVKRRDVPKTLIAYDILDYMVDHPDEALIDVNKRKAFQQFAQKVSTYLKESAKED